MKGISLSAVLQVINLERQSCDIQARADGKTGQLLLREGDLVDAIADDLAGEDAAYEILAWDDPEFEMSPQDAPVDRSISTGLTSLLLETARRKDEEGLENLLTLESENGDGDGEAGDGNHGSDAEWVAGDADGEAAEGAAAELPAAELAAEPTGTTPEIDAEPAAADVAETIAASSPGGQHSAGPLNAAALKRIIDMAQDGLGDALLSADLYSSADGTSFVGVNSMPAACALFNQVTSKVGQSLKKSGLPALGRYYMAELEGGKIMLVAPGADCQLSLVVDSTQVQLGLLLNVILPEMLAELQRREPSMRAFFVAGLEGSTLCFRKFLSALDSYEADMGVLLGDLTGRRVVSLIQTGEGAWEVPVDGKKIAIETQEAFAEATTAIEERGDYWVEQSREEYAHTAASPLMVDLLFKSLVRQRIEEWLALADARLGNGGPQVFVAPGCGDWTIIDDLFEEGHRMTPCDNRIIAVDGYEMVTCSASCPTDWDLAREIDERQLHDRLQGLCAGVGNPDYAIFNLQADSHAAQKIVKRYQPMLRLMGTVQGGAGGARKRGRTLELSPRTELIEDASRSLHGVMAILEDGEVTDYVFTDG